MASSKSRAGRPSHFRSTVRAPEQSRFQTLATLNIQPVSRATMLAWRPKLFAIGALAVLIAGLYVFFMEDAFFIEQVDSQGLNFLTAREVTPASGVLGYNIFFVEPGQVERALVKLPEVKSAHVLVGIPNSILIQVEERVPEFVWRKGDETYWVDGEGLAFKARSPRSDLPTVRDLDPTRLQAGKRVTPAAFQALRALHAAWQPAPRNFEWTPAEGLSTLDERGAKIIFGDAGDMALKVTKLRALLARLQAQGTRYKFIDLGKGEPFYQ